MQVFGYLRFSYYGRSDAQLSHGDDHQEYLDQLYDDDRMADRFHFFEHLCLPSLQRQTDKDFTLIVLASEVMPDQYKQRLKALVETIPQIVLVFSDNPDMADVFNKTAQDLNTDAEEKSIHFRLDDDDGLGASVVDDLRKMASNVNQHTILTMPNGLALVLDRKDGIRIYPEYQQYLAIGFAFVNMPGQIRNPFQCAHFAVAKRVPSMIEPRPLAYLHLLHEQSDSAVARGNMRKLPPFQKLEREQMDKEIARHFPSFTYESLNTICNTSPGMLAQRQIEAQTPSEAENHLKIVASK